MLYRIYIIYLIIVLMYFRIHDVKNNKIEKFIFSIFIPVFGLIVTIFSEMTESTKTKILKNTSSVTNNTDKSKEFLTHIQSSVIDDLLLKDYEKVREIILSTKSLPLKKQSEICQITIESKNVEISHISAVSLMRIKTHFEKTFAHYDSYLDLNKVENIEKYIKRLENYLDCNLVYGSLKNDYINKEILYLKELLEKKPDCEEKYYIMLINKCLQMQKNDDVKTYCNILLEKPDTSKEGYECVLMASYETKNKRVFKEVLKKLNSIPNRTQKINSILKFWEGEVE